MKVYLIVLEDLKPIIRNALDEIDLHIRVDRFHPEAEGYFSFLEMKLSDKMQKIVFKEYPPEKANA